MGNAGLRTIVLNMSEHNRNTDRGDRISRFDCTLFVGIKLYFQANVKINFMDGQFQNHLPSLVGKYV